VRRRGLLAVWLVLAGLIVMIAGLELSDRLRASRPDAGAADPRALLPVPVSALGVIEIADAGTLHRFERDATRAWFYHGAHGGDQAAHVHAPDPERAERIERAFAAFGRARIERELPSGRDGDPYGLAVPAVVILAYRLGASQPLAQYAVGHVAPDTASQYVMVVGRPGVVTIPKYQIDNLLTLVRPAGGEAGTGPAPAPAQGARH